jgi:hypothetical protein
MLRSTFRPLVAVLATALLSAGIVAAAGPAEAAVVSVHIQKAPVGSCLVPKVKSKVTAGAWDSGEPFYFADQSWRLASGNSDTSMYVAPCTTSHAVEIFAAKQLFTSVSQIPAYGTAAYTKLLREKVRPFCAAKARAFLKVPSTVKPPYVAYFPSKAQAKALHSLRLVCAFTFELGNKDGSSTMYTIGNKTWKYSGQNYFASTPVAPTVASATLTCEPAAGGSGLTVTRSFVLSADQRWIGPSRAVDGEAPFLDASTLADPSTVSEAWAGYPAQTPSATTLSVNQTWTVPNGTLSVTAPGTITTHWFGTTGKSLTYTLTTTATTLDTSLCGVV